MLISKRSTVSCKLRLLDKIFQKRMYYILRRWHDKTVKSQPKVQMILSNYAKQKKSSLVLANIIQRQKAAPMLALSVAKVATCFQVWKSLSSDLVRQYDGLARNVQLIQTTAILENLVLKQKAFAFSQIKTEARRLAYRVKVKAIMNMQLMEISAIQEPIFDQRTTNFLVAKVR